jgi:hypothetical protein
MVDIRVPTSFIWIIIFVNGPFEYGDGKIFKLLRWMQNLPQSKRNRTIVYADRPLKDEQVLIKPLLQECKDMDMTGAWN